jgi:formamidopyrimidine-DNA glycosylase
MPELPEVETVCRGLAEHILQARFETTILHRKNLRTPLPKNLDAELRGAKITHITRRAKYILIHLDNRKVLVIHLGMSGSVVLHNTIPSEYRTHDHVVFLFAAQKSSPTRCMVYYDPRRFGTINLVDANTLNTHPLFAHLGPDPLDDAMNGAALYALLQRSKAPIKTAIMDQQKLVGVGNIYACEALFRAKIHPATLAHTITKTQANQLMKHIKKVLLEAIASGGSTLRDYVRSSGDAGYFQHHFQVYGRAGQACEICATPISIIRQAGRSTFYCPHCQADD